MKKCVLCDDELDTDHPLSVYGRNPETFRKGWMHLYCFNEAFEQLQYERACSNAYMNRQDEYLNTWQYLRTD